MSIPLRHLGKGGPLVPAIGLGCMTMSNAIYGSVDLNESEQVLKKAIEGGCTFWDTADAYPNNEEFIAKVLVPNREKIFICTKFGLDFNNQTGVNGARAYVKQQCEASLKKLGVKQIDLYYYHRVSTETPIEETVGAMAELVKEGKVRYLGLSECSAATLRRAHAVHPIAALQVEYSPWCLDIETNGVLATCRELGVSIVAYSPLSRGFLTGKIQKFEDLDANDWRRQVPRFQGENFQKNLDIVKEFETMAKAKGVATSQLVLAWVLAQGEDFIIIPGTSKVRNLEENLGASKVHVSAEENAKIRKIIDSIPVLGERYPVQMMHFLNR